ncbi:flavocytochrome c [uncultured Parasutterella sp.]|uniref:FAD-dependent oxidoreductase n=1 Tax=uncultured Parasutterella sp. TaxID=1263098 RepID=UPI0026148AFE|nr:flavocytochrome c [uncultured Parasutterella sp.]
MLRRSFLGYCSIGTGLFVSGAALSEEEPMYDLIVVGSGAAALAAAVSASDEGLKNILVVEKEPIIGGSSAISGGAVAVSQTEFQRQQGVYDTDERFFNDLMKCGGYANDPSLVKTLVSGIRQQYDWIISKGLSPMKLMAASGMSLPRSHMFNSGLLIQLFREELSSRGIRIKTGCRAMELLQHNGRVVGVLVTHCGKSFFLQSRKGVVLATGGFARNQALLSRYAPQMKKVKVVSGIGSNGDGFLMALNLGAYFVEGETVQASYGFTKNPSTIRDFSTIYYSGAIILNREGNRFIDESLSYKTIGEASLKQPHPVTYIFFDESVRKIQMSRRPVDHALWSPFDRGLNPSYCFKGKSVYEVADKAGLNPARAEETVRKYNQSASEGIDRDYGRFSLSSGYGKLRALDRAPFYIMPSIAAIMGTYCGLKVDQFGRVLNKSNEPIAGLFAAGEIMGGVHGKNYITGTGLGKALVFGKISGKTAASV